jgi:hypothetical protein
MKYKSKNNRVLTKEESKIRYSLLLKILGINEYKRKSSFKIDGLKIFLVLYGIAILVYIFGFMGK